MAAPTISTLVVLCLLATAFVATTTGTVARTTTAPTTTAKTTTAKTTTAKTTTAKTTTAKTTTAKTTTAPTTKAPGPTVLEVATKYGAAKFASLASKSAYLKKLLTQPTPDSLAYTVFAFTDRAYDRAPSAVKRFVNDSQGLEWLVEYHISTGPTFSGDIKNNLLLTSLYPSPTTGSSLPPQFIRANVYMVYAEPGKPKAGYGKVVTASGSPIIRTDLPASNGIVHIIDKVIFPLPTGADMAEYLHLEARFSSLFMFLQTANLTSALKTDPSRPLTLFAPSNAAFANLPADVVKKLKDKAYLQKVLEYHVVRGALYAAGLYDNLWLRALNGQQLLVEIGPGGVYVQNGKVMQTDNTVTNGVVHEISAVLIPPSK